MQENRVVPRLIALAFAFAASAGIALAQSSYPSKPIRFVVGYPAGGPTDIVSRELSRPLADALGKPVVVDNRAGAAGTLGNDIVAKSPPDGYSVVLATSTMPIQDTMLNNLPYDTIKDFTFVGTVASGPLVLVVPPSLPVNNVRELIALAKTKPGEMNYASPSSGSANHLAAELLKIVPTVDAGGMHVVEFKPHRIIADRLNFQNHHIPLARNGLALVGRMALHLGARTFHAQIFRRQREAAAALESNRQRLAVLGKAQFGRPRGLGSSHSYESFPSRPISY